MSSNSVQGGRPLSVVLVGIGGYGRTYVNYVLDAQDTSGFRIAGGIDPALERCERLAELRDRRVPLYPSLENFYQHHQADLAVIAAPIHVHAPQTILALSHGSHVLCEKPLCGHPEQIAPMIAARDQHGKTVAVGYQWSFAPAVQELKRDIQSGLFGKPRRLRALVLWPRDEAYYGRNRWAGVIKDPAGNWVLDSPANNATAHFLHHMLFLLGDQLDRSAVPVSVQAELYRANAIQNYDTAAMRILTSHGVEVMFFVSHAVGEKQGPRFVMEFENATLHHGDDGQIIASLTDGSTRHYASPDLTGRDAKFWEVLSAVRENRPVACGIEAASAHTQVIWTAQQAGIHDFPSDHLSVEGAAGARTTIVSGLVQTLTRCFEQAKLPHELGVPWAHPAAVISCASLV